MKRCISLTLVLLMFAGAAFAQNFEKLIKKGSRHYNDGEINQALAYFLEAEKLEPGNVELNLHIGRAYLLSDFKHKALPYLTRVFKLAPTSEPDIRYYLGLASQYNYEFDNAIEHYKAYEQVRRPNKPDVASKIRQCLYADTLLQKPVAVDIQNLGTEINSKAHDYAPIITPDQSVLVFTSRREGSTGGQLTKDNEYFEDIYISYRRGENWTPPKQISKNINFDYHDAAAAISANGRELYVYIEDNGGDLYRSTFNGRDWSEPESLGEPINTVYWETSISITSDGKYLYFASDRPGGFGNLDIYVSERLESGGWGAPKNLGPSINTTGYEDSPFIHPDGKTLYFSSDGHPGLGGYDVFRSEAATTGWQKPINMGYPINTPDDNFHFIMAENRTHAYYTSIQDGGTGKADIYKITFLDEKMNAILAADRQRKDREKAAKQALQEQLIKQAAVQYQGQVLDADTQKPIEAIITVTHHVSGVVVAQAQSGPGGDFTMEIAEAGNYAVAIEANGYLILSRTLKISEKNNQRKIEAVMRMQPIKVGTTSIMANIFFDFGKASLRTESIGELDKMSEFLLNSPNIKIQINGHTDNVGKAAYNKQLSRKRAEAVMQYLVQSGVEPSRLSVMGYGPERPLVSNDDEEEGRALNRRTEIEVVSF